MLMLCINKTVPLRAIKNGKLLWSMAFTQRQLSDDTISITSPEDYTAVSVLILNIYNFVTCSFLFSLPFIFQQNYVLSTTTAIK